MDGWDESSFAEQQDVHADIVRVNRMLGGNRAILRELLKGLIPHETNTISILDVGCGDGELLRYLHAELGKAYPGKRFELEGWDYNGVMVQNACRISREQGDGIRFRQVDLLGSLPQGPTYDIVLSVLTFHHFDDEEIVAISRGLLARTRKALFVSDLERSLISYYLFYVFSRLFLRTPTAMADGLTSIRKGFRPKDFTKYQERVSAYRCSLRWVWAFRYHWVVKKDTGEIYD